METETRDVSLSVIPAQAGIQFSVPGFRVAACGLARDDGRVVFVIPANAGIQGGDELGILFLSSAAKQSVSEVEIASSPPAPRNDTCPSGFQTRLKHSESETCP